MNEVGGLARRLDLLAVDAAGNVLGSVTDDGFLRYGSYYIGGRADSERYAIYLADSWQATDALTFDAGIRNEWYDQTGLRWLTETRNFADPTTIADNAQQGNSGRTASSTSARLSASLTLIPRSSMQALAAQCQP